MNNQIIVDNYEKKTEIIKGILAKVSKVLNTQLFAIDKKTMQILYANEIFIETMQDFIKTKDIIGKSVDDVIDCPNATKSQKEIIDFLIGEHSIYTIEKQKKHKEKLFYFKTKDEWLKFTAVVYETGMEDALIVISIFSETHIKFVEEELINKAYFNKTLNIGNAKKLENDLKLIPNYMDYHILEFDIRSFRNINYVYSRAIGDKTLHEIKEYISTLDIVFENFYRIDGDEFAIVLKGLTHEEVSIKAKKIKARFDLPWEIMDNNNKFEVYCSINIGIAKKYYDSFYKSSILLDVKTALATAKLENKDIVFFDEKQKEFFEEKQLFENEIKNLVLNNIDEFSLLYQPIVDANSLKWIGIEAIPRWNSKKYGTVDSKTIISVLERVGLILNFDLWVLETAIKFCKEIKLDEIFDFFLDVSVSSNLLAFLELDNKVSDILLKHNFSFEKLVLKFSENYDFNIDKYSDGVIKKLKEKGIKIAIDNFGAGYSAFEKLNSLPVTFLKTCENLIKSISDDSYIETIYKLINELAKTAEMEIIANGVENEAQSQILTRNGVSKQQGSYHNKPICEEELRKMKSKFYLDKTFVIYDFDIINISGNVLANKNFVTITKYSKLSEECLKELFYRKNFYTAVDNILILMRKYMPLEMSSYVEIPTKKVSINDINGRSIPIEQQENYFNLIGNDINFMLKYLGKKGLYFIVKEDYDVEIQEKISRNNLEYAIIIPIYNNGEVYSFITAKYSNAISIYNIHEMQILFNIAILITNRIKKDFF